MNSLQVTPKKSVKKNEAELSVKKQSLESGVNTMRSPKPKKQIPKPPMMEDE
jgi:hypothetical protein